MRIDERLPAASSDRPEGRLRATQGLLPWLMRWSHGTPMELRPAMGGALLSSPGAIILGAINGLLLAALAVYVIGGVVITAIAVAQLLLLLARLVSQKRVAAIRAKGEVPAIDTSVYLSILWCALQGGLLFFAMRSANPVMMVICTAHCMGLVGPLCARNYAAPKLALLLVSLCVGPLILGAISTGEPLMLALLVLLPGFMLGSTQLLAHYRNAMLTALHAEMINADRARHDPLTGLLNRHGLERIMKGLASDEVFSLACFDLDGFKPINDRFGHAAGDRLLCEVADRMKDALTDGQVLARIGGDEFLALLKGQGPLAAETTIDRVLSRVSDAPYAVDAKSLVEIGVTAGFACYPEDATNIADLHILADRAMYAAKEAGKGFGTRYEPSLAA